MRDTTVVRWRYRKTALESVAHDLRSRGGRGAAPRHRDPRAVDPRSARLGSGGVSSLRARVPDG